MLRFDIINALIKKNNYTKYLEIGVENGHSMHQIDCQLIHGVDPASKHAIFEVESDHFFKMLDYFNPDFKYDIIFIDGLHVADQVDRDIINSLNHLSPNGIIVVHDCNPPTAWHARTYQEAKKNGCRQWNGNVWESIVKVRAVRSDLKVEVVNTDWGCGLISRSEEPQELIENLPDNLEYDYLHQNRQKVLNLISPEEFIKTYL